MRVLVTGSRKMEDKATVFRTLSRLHQAKPITLLIHGGAAGADSFAGEWAEVNRVNTSVFKPDWRRYGRGAGPKRNEEMAATNPDVCVAFSGDNGTADMVKRATRRGIPVVSVADGGSYKTAPGSTFRWHDGLDAEIVFVTLSDWRKSNTEVHSVSVLVLHSTYEHVASSQVVTLRGMDQIWVNSTELS